MWFHCKPFLSVSVNSRIYLRKHLDYADESVITIKQTKTTKMSSFHQVSNKVNHKKLSMLLTREFGQPPLSSLFLHLRPHAPLLLLPRLPCPGSYLSPDGPSCSRAVLPRLLTDATTQLPSLTWASLKFLSIGSLPSASEYAMISLILREKNYFIFTYPSISCLISLSLFIAKNPLRVVCSPSPRLSSQAHDPSLSGVSLPTMSLRLLFQGNLVTSSSSQASSVSTNHQHRT